MDLLISPQLLLRWEFGSAKQLILASKLRLGYANLHG